MWAYPEHRGRLNEIGSQRSSDCKRLFRPPPSRTLSHVAPVFTLLTRMQFRLGRPAGLATLIS
jgi:hypothetical protein